METPRIFDKGSVGPTDDKTNSEATPFTPVEPETDVNREAVQKLTTETFNKLKQSGRSRYPEHWRGRAVLSDILSDARGRPYLIVCINIEEGLPSAPLREYLFLRS